jgi:hypothetical protein
MLNEELVVISRIQKYLKESYQNIADAMIGGGVDNMEKYKYMLGQAQAYLIISQEHQRRRLRKSRKLNRPF